MISKLITADIDERLSFSMNITGVKSPKKANVGSRNPIMVNKSTTITETINIAMAT